MHSFQFTFFCFFFLESSVKDQRTFSAKVQAKTKETKLVQQMKSRISATGPITVAEYMKEVGINPMSVSIFYITTWPKLRIDVSFNEFINVCT